MEFQFAVHAFYMLSYCDQKIAALHNIWNIAKQFFFNKKVVQFICQKDYKSIELYEYTYIRSFKRM